MIKNYFVIAVRHLVRHKLFTFINILCLAIGITFSLLIGDYALHETGVNSELRNVNNLYLVKSKWKTKDMGPDMTTVAPLVKSLKDQYPDLVTNYYRFDPITNVVSAGEKHFREDIAIGDTSLVSLFGFKVLYGDPHRAFTDIHSAVLTDHMARKLFGTENALHKIFTIDQTIGGKDIYQVSAVISTPPLNSVTDFIKGDHYQIFVPNTGNNYFPGGDPLVYWNSAYTVGMVELKNGVRPEQLKNICAKLLASNAPASISDNLQVEFTPLKNYYLHDNEDNGAAGKLVSTLLFIAGLILLMATINFINISIGTSTYRLKEIGLRKVFGSNRSRLVLQFITESLLLTLLAAFLSLIAYQLLIPTFEQVLNTHLDALYQFSNKHILYFFIIVLLTGILSGLYPAFVLSASETIKAVKGKTSSAVGGIFLRKGLLLVQFSLAIIVFISALNVSNQVHYIFNKDLGYNKDQVMVITAFPKQWDSAGVRKMNAIRDGLLQLPAVKNSTISFEVPERKPPNSLDYKTDDSHPVVLISTLVADEHFAETFGLKVIDGSFFKQNGAYIPNQVVLNESAVKALGLKDPVGKIIRVPSFKATLTIAGVVKDFHYTTLQEGIGPIIFSALNDNLAYRFISVKLTGNVENSIASVKKKWMELAPNSPFDFYFMDEKLQSIYQSELQLKKAAAIATLLNMVIVLLGIFGVVAFTLTRRTKEIAVRKVLGANVWSIIQLFWKEYGVLIIISNIISFPIAYYINNRWLENYAYRIQQNIFSFVFVGIGTLLIAFLLIGLQSYSVANANPARTLKVE